MQSKAYIKAENFTQLHYTLCTLLYVTRVTMSVPVVMYHNYILHLSKESYRMYTANCGT